MIMADILYYFLIVFGLYLSFISYWLASEALVPNLVERCRERYASAPFGNLILGLLVALPTLTGGFVLITRMGSPMFQILGFIVILFPLLMGLIGSAGLCRQIGCGLASPLDEHQPWRRVLRGGILLGLTFILPFLGWFGVMPLALLSGMGAFVRAVWIRRQKFEAASQPG